MSERIVVTRVGALAPGAANKDELAKLLALPPPPPPTVTLERPLPARTVGETGIAARDARRLTRPALLALAATREALAGLALEGLGLALGTGFGSVEATRLALEALFERADYVSPTHFVGSVRHDAASALGRLAAIRGPTVATSARRLSFEEALAWALVQLRARRARAMLAVGTDEATPLLARLLARGRTGAPLVLGEGAAALLLEREDDARAAGRAPLATVAALARGAGSPAEQADSVRAACSRAGVPLSFDLVLTDEEGSARRTRDAVALLRALGVETPRRAIADHVGHVAAGGALVAAAGALEVAGGRARRVLVTARERDASFVSYVLEAPS